MTLEEAIKHAEEVAEKKENEGKLLCQSEGASIGCLTCAKEHRQLAEWLKELKQLREQTKWIPVSEKLPEAFEYVNCTCHSLIDDRENWVVETFYLPQSPNSAYSDWGNIPMLNHHECEVIAWMYRNIPEPYKAESEEV
jgi:hypothetical protein